MPWTEIRGSAFSRRTFLKALGGIPFLATTSVGHSLAGASLLDPKLRNDPLFASARRNGDGSFALAIVDEAGQDLAIVHLPARGHGMAATPNRSRIVIFARRPGTFALLLDPFSQREPSVLTSMNGRHFYGHGCFSKDGRLLYAAENDYEAGQGVIGIYDVSSKAATRLGEFATGGIGPHDIRLTKDGKTLVVANGGIRTHPAQPRQKLNIGTMIPSVAYLNAESGDLLVRHSLPKDLHQLSLRHLALDQFGQVWVGGQYEGPRTDRPPLVVRMTPDSEPTLIDIPATATASLQNYIGSVMANASGEIIATSAPRGGKILLWSAETGNLLGSQAIADGCGLAPIDKHAFLISDGNGGLSVLEEPQSVPDVLARPVGVSWDNHMLAL